MFIYIIVGIAFVCVCGALVKRYVETNMVTKPTSKKDFDTTKIEDGMFFTVKQEKKTTRKNVNNTDYCLTLF